MRTAICLPSACAATDTHSTSLFLKSTNPTFCNTLWITRFPSRTRAKGTVREREEAEVRKRYAERSEDESKQRKNRV